MTVQQQSALTADEVRQLTRWKWRYTLQSAGFSAQEARRLCFQKWRHATGVTG